MALKAKRTRDYKAEYARRIARGVAKGKSRSQARGHARANEGGKKAGTASIDRESKFEKALKLMKRGVSQKKAAKEAGISAESLRRYQKENTTSRRVGLKWVIVDTRSVPVASCRHGHARQGS